MLRGIVLSATASVLFAVLYYYAVLLQPLDGMPIFGWRIVLGLPALTAWVLALGSGAALLALWRRVRREPMLALGLLVSAHLIGAQMALFMWAPLHGRALEVSLGYFLLPLVMVLAGRVVYGERLNRWQQLAVLLIEGNLLGHRRVAFAVAAHQIQHQAIVTAHRYRAAHLHAGATSHLVVWHLRDVGALHNRWIE